MDYHFVKGRRDPKPPEERVFVLRSAAKKFTPVLMLAALLPVFLFLVYSPPDLRYAPSASDDHELRIWIEPKTSVSSQGNQIEMDVVALFETESTLTIPKISFELDYTDGLVVSGDTITSSKPFSGQKTIGSVVVTASGSGEQTLSIDEETIEIIAFDEELKIVTSPSTIFVK